MLCWSGCPSCISPVSRLHCTWKSSPNPLPLQASGRPCPGDWEVESIKAELGWGMDVLGVALKALKNQHIPVVSDLVPCMPLSTGVGDGEREKRRRWRRKTGPGQEHTCQDLELPFPEKGIILGEMNVFQSCATLGFRKHWYCCVRGLGVGVAAGASRGSGPRWYWGWSSISTDLQDQGLGILGRQSLEAATWLS